MGKNVIFENGRFGSQPPLLFSSCNIDMKKANLLFNIFECSLCCRPWPVIHDPNTQFVVYGRIALAKSIFEE